jgi:hypothetical protein
MQYVVCATSDAPLYMYMPILTLAGQQIHMPASEGHSSSTVQSGCCSDTEWRERTIKSPSQDMLNDAYLSLWVIVETSCRVIVEA